MTGSRYKDRFNNKTTFFSPAGVVLLMALYYIYKVALLVLWANPSFADFHMAILIFKPCLRNKKQPIFPTTR